MTFFQRLRPTTTPAASRLPSWVWMVLLAALIVAPWLGTVHGVLHAKAPVTVAAPAQGGDAGQGSDLLRLFGDHGHNGDCRLYDQLSHADGLHLSVSLPPVVLPPVAVLAWHAGECLRRWAALFDARGPPSLA